MILCCGEALIDMIPTPSVEGPDGFVPHAGGAVFNTAIALGRLGVATGMLGGVSRDMFGQHLLASLRASHVDTSFVSISDRPSTLAFVKLTNGHAAYSFFDEGSANRMLQPDDLRPLSKDVTALFFGGISLACEPCADTYAHLLRTEGNNRVVVMDPNIRPSFIQDADRFRARLNQMIARADVVKVSDEDLSWLYPNPLTLREKTELLLESGPAIVILTRGAGGATGYTSAGDEVSVLAQKVEVVDTVGAGDTFNAGVMSKLAKLGQLSKIGLRDISAKDLDAALQHGTRVAAVTVTRAGANPPWAREL